MNEAPLLAELDEYMPSFVGEPGEWNDVLSRCRRPHRRRKVAIASLIAALVAVPTALAFGNQLVNLFEGTPATPAIQATFIAFNGRLSAAVQSHFSVQPVDTNQIRGVVAIQTSEGPVDLWSAPQRGGGTCDFVQYANQVAPDNAESGAGGCNPSSSPNSGNILDGNYYTASHASLRIIYGYTYGAAESVEIDLTDGSSLSLPVTEGYFLAATGAGTQVNRIVSYDGQGNQVGETSG